METQPNVKGPGLSQGTQEGKVDELELKLVAMSKEKLASVRDDVEMIRPWGDYTLCVNKNNSNNIDIYNDKLQIVTTLNKKISINIARVAFSEVGNTSSASEYIYKDQYLKLSPLVKIASNIQSKNKLEMGDYSFFFGSAQKESYIPNIDKNLTLLEEGKYVIMVDRSLGYYKAFKTENNQGIKLDPKDWETFVTGSRDLPKDLEEKILEIFKQKNEIRDINDKYSSILTDVGINIVSKDDIEGKVMFSENLASIRSNISIDPTNKNILYFCQEGAPKDIVRLDMSADPSSWKTEYAPIAKDYKEIKNLSLDPTGTFFIFYSGNDLVMATKDKFEEVKRMEGITNVNFDSQGRIRAVDKDGYLVLYDVDYTTLNTKLAKDKAQKIASGVDINDIFSQKKQAESTYDEKTKENLQPIKTNWEADILPKIAGVGNIEEVLSLRNNLNILRQTLRSQNIGSEQIKFITEGIEKAIGDKEKEYAGQEVIKYFTDVETILAGPISISTINELRLILDKVKPIENVLDIKEREKARKLTEEVNKRAVELFGREGSKVIEELNNLIDGTKKQLDSLVNKNEFDDWMEFRFPQLKSRLGTLLQDCPLEAFDAATAITNARNSLVQIADNYSHKFELEYAKVREQASERSDTVVQTLHEDVGSVANRLATKQFKTREEAEQYLATSEAKRVLEEEIQELGKSNPDAAKELERSLKSTIANSLGYIERGGSNIIAETGQQMVMFGETVFPRFEGKVKEKHSVNVGLTFVLDESSKGPGISPNKFYGDVELIVTNTKGEKQTVRLYESLGNEDEWRLGMLSYRGDSIPASYVTVENFKTIKKNLNAWENGELKETDNKLRMELSDLFATRAKVGKRDSENDAEWQKIYKEKLEAYGKFCSENHILFFRRMEKVKNENTIDGNGKGYVPKWQNHWVTDPTTEVYLEKMAKHFKMQGDLQEGILNLYGHAGTGKDVLIKMFASKEKANRPYFAIDCTKWTTEYELAEDVALEAKNGATQTVRVPSSVLTGIQTPGGLVYFNEINGMPEQAQIFLHALLDEKRAMTLKTSSGKVIQALPSVLFACSMNPNYPGTFEPQFATKSRMTSIEIDYPELRRKIKDGEPEGKEEPYNSSEALRIARGTESLVDFTYELNMEKNDFVKIWDNKVNGINNDAAPISKTQEFDLNVIKGLIQFSNRLRQDFKKNFEKTSDKRDALPVFQPITLREMRRCAYTLSKMPETEKISKDSDDVARELIKNFFLSNIYKTDDRKKIEDALKVMHSKNRLM